MIKNTFKAAFTFDSETQTFKPAAHNLSAGQAVEQFKNDSTTKILDQPGRHRSSDALRCQACKKTAELLTNKHIGSSSGTENQAEHESAGTGNDSE